MKMFRPDLKFKILSLIFVFISVSAIILILSTYSKLRNDILQKNSEIFQTFTDIFHSEKDILTKKYSMSLDILMENRAVLDAFRLQDRNKLKSLINDLYNNRLKNFYDIEQLHFHLSPAVSLYRVHAPSKFGDDLSGFRKTVLKANLSKSMVAGLEVGRAGLGLRVVKPVWNNYDFIGTVELGGNINNLLSTPANATKIEYAVGIFMKSLEKSNFFDNKHNKITYKNMHIYDYSSPQIKDLITSSSIDRPDELIHAGNQYFMVKHIPLKDFSSDQIGYLLLSRDTTAEVSAMHTELLKQVIIIFSYALAAVALLSVILIKLIFSPLDKITNHITAVQKETDIPIKPVIIKGKSEIATLAAAFNLMNVKLAESFERINTQMHQIQEINTSLERRVSERTQQLELTNTRLKNAMGEIQFANEAKSEFLASMSHEIRTPMNAVLGLSYLMMQTELTGKQYDYISKIRSSANLLLEIVNDVLDFSKIEAGKLELETDVMNLKDNIKRIAGIIEVTVSKKNVSVQLEIDENIPDYLVGDSLRITQVLNNLATNAAKFTEQGHIEISAFLLTKNKNYAKIRITVSDTGIGIPTDKIPILFDSFTQVKRKNQKKQSGSGLGLSISKKILNAMESDITVESKEGEGSVFTFILTLMIADKDAIVTSCKNEEKLNNKRILVCEPAQQDCGSVTSFFRENMADVLNVTNQFSLIKQISKNTDCSSSLIFDMLVIDTSTLTDESFSMIRTAIENISKETFPPVILISGNSRITDAANEAIGDIRLFVVHKDQAMETLPSLAYELLMGEQSVKPDVECLKRTKHTNSGIKALIVDDNSINIQVVTEFADMLGLSYVTAKSGTEAVRKANESEFDIIFIDIIMPEMDGITATEKIRQNPKHAKTPIYALSASTMPEDVNRCRRAGMNGHIAKPVKLQDITMALRDCAIKTPSPEHTKPNEIDIPAGDELLNTEEALSNLNGNKKLYLELLTKYYSEYAGLDIKTRHMLKDSSPAQAKVFFHTIKGVAKTLGATKLSEYAEALEIMTDSHTQLLETPAMEHFCKEGRAIDLKLRDFLKNNPL
ncbi:integral membrane sensor hybrid histidine kinase [Denitrovibrio acetiphilus DSM 12809]|uniref:Sensory/regulatory protein RpfC n=1 Tax=Denitrovibrio acetiphilus (strain DSM 12809 / NBRC 114555 / N2460) TaxID=522772 RepID=D4H0I2_DENA2|nr:ATP-binding protein [Denitrovibrio acetiphilus]ADD68495.1 integral membrane sensor hybrid histidine kinase [Denitrovibrio acetiphilus DSM 12809]